MPKCIAAMCLVITMLSSLSPNIHGCDLYVVVWMLEMKMCGGFSCGVCRIYSYIVATLPDFEYNTVCG
jgi:hypothetical protein